MSIGITTDNKNVFSIGEHMEEVIATAKNNGIDVHVEYDKVNRSTGRYESVVRLDGDKIQAYMEMHIVSAIRIPYMKEYIVATHTDELSDTEVLQQAIMGTKQIFGEDNQVEIYEFNTDTRRIVLRLVTPKKDKVHVCLSINADYEVYVSSLRDANANSIALERTLDDMDIDFGDEDGGEQ